MKLLILQNTSGGTPRPNPNPMKRFLVPLCVAFALASAGCRTAGDRQAEIEALVEAGRFAEAEAEMDADASSAREIPARTADSLREIMRRIRIEFPYDRSQIVRTIRRTFSDTVSDERIERWSRSGELERRIIDGEERYFVRAAGNLPRLSDEMKAFRPSDSAEERMKKDDAARAIALSDGMGACCDPLGMTIRYTLRVEPNAVPEGDTVRCWLPYPRRDLARVRDVELLGTSPAVHIVAPADAPHSSVYMERTAVRDSATVFTLAYRLTTLSQYFDPQRLSDSLRPYDTASDLYKTYTAQRPPHIVFGPRLADKARELTGDETDPLRITARIYDWIDAEFPWAGAIEYGVLPCIPEYVLDAGHGDCGQVTLLLIAMLRSVGIPAGWESGWIVENGRAGLHDWGKVYYEGVGWVPVDMSYGTIATGETEAVRTFYRTGLENHRLPVNSDYGRAFYPAKRHMRSEPVDFQRGEAETSRRNLYFDEWSYAMEVRYDEPRQTDER